MCTSLPARRSHLPQQTAAVCTSFRVSSRIYTALSFFGLVLPNLLNLFRCQLTSALSLVNPCPLPLHLLSNSSPSLERVIELNEAAGCQGMLRACIPQLENSIRFLLAKKTQFCCLPLLRRFPILCAFVLRLSAQIRIEFPPNAREKT